MASNNVERVFLIYLQLSSEERNEFVDRANDYNQLLPAQKRLDEEVLRKAFLRADR